MKDLLEKVDRSNILTLGDVLYECEKVLAESNQKPDETVTLEIDNRLQFNTSMLHAVALLVFKDIYFYHYRELDFHLGNICFPQKTDVKVLPTQEGLPKSELHISGKFHADYHNLYKEEAYRATVGQRPLTWLKIKHQGYM